MEAARRMSSNYDFVSPLLFKLTALLMPRKVVTSGGIGPTYGCCVHGRCIRGQLMLPGTTT